MYAVEYEVPGDAELYGRVKSATGDEHPDDQQDRFHREHVEPAVHGVLRSIGFTEMPPESVATELVLVDVVTGC